MNMKAGCGAAVAAVSVLLCACEKPVDPAAYENYEIVSQGTRQYEWDTDTGPGIIKILIEAQNLGSQGAEVAEIWFPPGFEGTAHPHELEIIYVVEGELDHIVNGKSHILTAGMVGVVRERDRVVHKTHSPEGVKTLVIWPLGKEVEGFEASGMRTRLLSEAGNN